MLREFIKLESWKFIKKILYEFYDFKNFLLGNITRSVMWTNSNHLSRSDVTIRLERHSPTLRQSTTLHQVGFTIFSHRWLKNIVVCNFAIQLIKRIKISNANILFTFGPAKTGLVLSLWHFPWIRLATHPMDVIHYPFPRINSRDVRTFLLPPKRKAIAQSALINYGFKL